MDKSIEMYLKAIKGHFNLYANWLPGSPIRLGDYGRLRNNVFERIGNIHTDFGIEISHLNGEPHNYDFKTKHSINIINSEEVSGDIQEIANVKASFKIDFLTENSIYFSIPQGAERLTNNLKTVGEKVLDMYEQGKWDEEFVVVTRFVKAPTAMIIISHDKDASIVLETDVEQQTIQTFDVNANFKVKSENNIAFSIVSQNNIIPLIGLSKLKFKFFKGIDFETISGISYKSSPFKIEYPENLMRNIGFRRNKNAHRVPNRNGHLNYIDNNRPGHGLSMLTLSNNHSKYGLTTVTREINQKRKNNNLYMAISNVNMFKNAYKKQVSEMALKSKVITVGDITINDRTYTPAIPTLEQFIEVGRKSTTNRGCVIEALALREVSAAKGNGLGYYDKSKVRTSPNCIRSVVFEEI